MRQLNAYVSSTVGASILLVLVVIVGLDVIAALVDESKNIRGKYTFAAALRYVMLSVPGSIYEYLPFASLVGCLAGLGVLANSSELVVIRSAGVSVSRIVWMVMRPTMIIMLVGVAISEYIAPHTESIAQSEKAIALRSKDVVSRHGLWHREGNQFMHFSVVQANGKLFGVSIYEFDEQRRLQRTVAAERAIFQGDRWLLEDVSESRFFEERVEQTTYPSKIWIMDLSPRLLNILILDPMDLSIQGLWQYASYLRNQNLNGGPYELAFWKKLLQPLSTVALVLVAISFIFGPLRQVTMGFRIFTGVLVGIVFRTVQDMLVPASLVYGFAPIYASLIPILICSAAGLLLLRRAR
jgi:lipopolysaccharide export system permease protein